MKDKSIPLIGAPTVKYEVAGKPKPKLEKEKHVWEDFEKHRYEINSLLSDPKPYNLVWKAKLICKLDKLVQLLGLELKDKE